jgi:hypothetical protein
MVRWVPYKHANGMAIYYRQTPAEEGITTVRAADCSVGLVASAAVLCCKIEDRGCVQDSEMLSV